MHFNYHSDKKKLKQLIIKHFYLQQTLHKTTLTAILYSPTNTIAQFYISPAKIKIPKNYKFDIFNNFYLIHPVK